MGALFKNVRVDAFLLLLLLLFRTMINSFVDGDVVGIGDGECDSDGVRYGIGGDGADDDHGDDGVVHKQFMWTTTVRAMM